MFIPRLKYVTPKRLKQLERDVGGSKYQEWRRSCLVRDGFKCQFPGCSMTTGLQVHHIKRFADNPHLRTNIYNGITLCTECHRKIHSKERQYEVLFLKIVLAKDNK